MNHFSKKTIKALARKGIALIGLQALPVNGSFANCDTGYVLNDNGTCRVLRFLEVLELAA